MAGDLFVAGCTVSRYAADCAWYCKGRGFVQTVARLYSCHLQACNILGYPHCQLWKIAWWSMEKGTRWFISCMVSVWWFSKWGYHQDWVCKLLPLLCDLMGQSRFAAVGEFKYLGSILSCNISECVELQRLRQARRPWSEIVFMGTLIWSKIVFIGTLKWSKIVFVRTLKWSKVVYNSTNESTFAINIIYEPLGSYMFWYQICHPQGARSVTLPNYIHTNAIHVKIHELHLLVEL